jgi:hypothetical protein
MKTIREQEEARRRTKLNSIRRQVKTGRLVVRQMTDEERAQFATNAPPTPTPHRVEGRRG